MTESPSRAKARSCPFLPAALCAAPALYFVGASAFDWSPDGIVGVSLFLGITAVCPLAGFVLTTIDLVCGKRHWGYAIALGLFYLLLLFMFLSFFAARRTR